MEDYIFWNPVLVFAQRGRQSHWWLCRVLAGLRSANQPCACAKTGSALWCGAERTPKPGTGPYAVVDVGHRGREASIHANGDGVAVTLGRLFRSCPGLLSGGCKKEALDRS
jgi:hypothetical protein